MKIRERNPFFYKYKLINSCRKKIYEKNKLIESQTLSLVCVREDVSVLRREIYSVKQWVELSSHFNMAAQIVRIGLG